jgi:hypothetical protein
MLNLARKRLPRGGILEHFASDLLTFRRGRPSLRGRAALPYLAAVQKPRPKQPVDLQACQNVFIVAQQPLRSITRCSNAVYHIRVI